MPPTYPSEDIRGYMSKVPDALSRHVVRWIRPLATGSKLAVPCGLIALALVGAPVLRATTLKSPVGSVTETDTGCGPGVVSCSTSSAIPVSAQITFTVLDATHLEVLVQNTQVDPFVNGQNISAVSFQVYQGATLITPTGTNAAIAVCNSGTVAVGTCDTPLTVNNSTASSKLSAADGYNPTASANGNINWYLTTGTTWGGSPTLGTGGAIILSSQNIGKNPVDGQCTTADCGGLTSTSTSPYYCSTANPGSGTTKNSGGVYCFPSIIGAPGASGYDFANASCQGHAFTNTSGTPTTTGACNTVDSLTKDFTSAGGGTTNYVDQSQMLYESAAFVLTFSNSVNLNTTAPTIGRAFVAMGPDGPDTDDWIDISAPEPASFVLMGAGLSLLGFRKYRSAKK